MDKLLTDEQYAILAIEEPAFKMLISQLGGKNFHSTFLNKFHEIYKDVFGGSPLTINCGPCIENAIHRIWPYMEAKKAEFKQREEDKIIQDQLKQRDAIAKEKGKPK